MGRDIPTIIFFISLFFYYVRGTCTTAHSRLMERGHHSLDVISCVCGSGGKGEEEEEGFLNLGLQFPQKVKSRGGRGCSPHYDCGIVRTVDAPEKKL